jgi:ubiquinone/menaquinone biosynthesis C-methylase UbiE
MRLTDSDVSNAAKAVGIVERFVSVSDYSFFHRVFETPYGIYLERNRRSGLTGNDRVLDAGCGYGQWSLALAESNRHVVSLDLDPERIELLRRLKLALGRGSIQEVVGRLECIPFPDSSFDLVFCYSAIYFGDWRKSVAELVRVTKSGGSIYINSNAIGWYLYNLISARDPNGGRATSLKRMALRAIGMSYISRFGFPNVEGYQSVISSRRLCRQLQESGTRIEGIAGDGCLGVSVPRESHRSLSFFDTKKYGFESVYEVLAKKC